MPRNRNMTPGRYLRRSKPYLIFAVALIVLIAAVILVVRQVRSMSSAQKPDPSSTAQTQPSQDAADKPQPGTPSEPDVPASNVYVPPFDGTVTPLANSLLRAAYDEAQLKLTSDAQLDSFTSVTDGQIARIDVQKLRSSMELLKKDELSRVAIGVLQGYYYAAPATEDISITVSTDTDGEFAAALSAESYGGAPAITARVRLLELDGSLWCVSAIFPDGEDCAALQQTYDSIIVRTADMVIEGA